MTSAPKNKGSQADRLSGSRRSLREAALQLLYSQEAHAPNKAERTELNSESEDADEALQETSPAEEQTLRAERDELFWQLIQERDIARLQKKQKQLLRSQLESLRTPLDKLFQNERSILSKLKIIDLDEGNENQVSSFKNLLQDGDRAMNTLETFVDAEPNATHHAAGEALQALSELEASAQNKQSDGAEISKKNSPLAQELSSPLQKILKTLPTLTALLAPQSSSENQLAAPLSSKLESLQKMRQQIEDWVNKVSKNRQALDELISKSLKNYQVERLLSVERNLLRLLTYELREENLPAAVAVTEAAEIAERFSGADSASFVSGVVNEIAENLDSSKA